MKHSDLMAGLTDILYSRPPADIGITEGDLPDKQVVAHLTCEYEITHPDHGDHPCGWEGDAVVSIWHKTDDQPSEALWWCAHNHENSATYTDYP